MSDHASISNIEYVQNNKKLSDSKRTELERLFNKVSNQLLTLNIECERAGYVLFCSPCQKHRDEKYDALILDILAQTRVSDNSQYFWTCAKDPLTYSDQYYTFSSEELELLRNYKPAKGEITRAQTEIVVRNYLSNHHVITIKQEERYAIFVYDENKGKYTSKGKEVLKGELQSIHDSLYQDTNVSSTLLESAILKIAELTNRGSDMSIFENDNGDIYYIPAKKKDVEVSRNTGMINFLDKDPDKRPFLSALPYNFDIPAPDEMPPELMDLLTLVPQAFHHTLLFELVSPLAFQARRYIIVNFSRVGGTGKTTLLRRIEELYPDLAVWTEASRLGERFEKSAFLGKTALLIDEYEGGGLATKRQLKTLASSNTLRVEVKYGPVLNIKNRLSLIMNTNVLAFDSDDKALLQRLVIVPFIRNFKENEIVNEWDEKTREKIVLYLTKHILPLYFVEEPKRYPLSHLIEWTSHPENPPYDGIDEFLRLNAYPEYTEKARQGVLVSIDEAFFQYLAWCDRVDYIPVSRSEFIDKLKFLANRDGKWLVDEDKVYFKKNAFVF